MSATLLSGAISHGEGLFRKQGSAVKNWKVRKYELFSSCELVYSDAVSNTVKGSMNISNVSVREGTRENIRLSCCPNKDGYAMDVMSYEDGRTLEVVFDSIEEAKKFLQVLSKCAKKHNISQLCGTQGWVDLTISTDIPPATPPPTPAATASAVSTPLKDQIESPQLSSPVASAATPTSTVAFEDADTEGRIGSGNFRKKGANVKNWKVRKYIIKRDGTLLYLDPSNGALKGTLSCKIIELYKGNPKNIDESGCTILTHNDTGFALDLHIIDGSRKLEVVFDSVSDAQTFVEFLRVVATSHNIPSFLQSTDWGSKTAEQSAASVSSKEHKDHMFKMKPSSPVVIYSYLMHHKTLQRKEAQSSTTSPTVDTSEVSLIQEGIVRKHGFRLNHWKIKGYSIYSNRRLIFYHVDGMESTRKASVRENSFILNGNLFTQLKYVYCRSGDESHIDASGAADYSSEHGVAIDILCSDSVDEYADICTEIGNNRSVVQLLASLSNSTTCIQLVFDTANAAKSFLEAITKISLKNNVQSFAKSLGWAVEIDPETLTAFAEMNEEVRVREEQVASGKCIEEVKEEVQQVVKEDEVEGSATLRTASINSTSTTATASSRRVSGRFVDIATKTVNAAGSMASGTVNAAGRVGMISATAVLDSVKDKSVVKEGVDTVRVIGEGVFIKQGSNVKSWKTRKYVLTSDHVLWYYDMSGNVLKGSVTVKNIRVGDGSPDAIRSCGLNSTLQAAAVGIGIKSMTDNRVLEVVLHTPNDAKLFLRQLVEASLHNNIPSFVSKFGWDPNEFTESETLSATLVLESSNEKENAANKVDATGVDASPDGSSTDSKATAADDKKSNDLVAVIEKKKDIFPLSLLHMDLKSTFTFSNGIEILKNVGSVACCLSKKIIALDKAAWIVFVVWMLSFVYIRDKPSLTRIVLFIIYNVGIYNIILTPLCDHHLNHAECEEAVKPIPINEIVQNRNWNIKKKQ